MRRLNIRWRLTLWFCAAMTVLLLVRSFWIYYMLERRLMDNTDFELAVAVDVVAEEVQDAKTIEQLREVLEQHAANHRDMGIKVTTAEATNVIDVAELQPRGHLARAASHDPERRAATTVSADGARHRQVTGTVSSALGPLKVGLSRSLQAEENEARDFVIILLTTGPMVIAAALAVGYLVSSRALTPVDAMISAAKHITARRLDQRIDVPDTGDELARLAQTLNEMIDRLHNSFEEMRRFTADAAHDLRTPVAALRTEVEVGLMANTTIEEYRESLQTVLDEAIHLSRLTGQLLDLSREDHGVHREPDEEVPIDAILRDAISDLHTAAHQKRINVEVRNVAATNVRGDQVRLRRLFMNLLDNAIQYTPAGGRVWLEGEVRHGQLRVTVADNGPGVPAEDLPHIFDRFRRVDKARNRQMGGTGLGLAICKSIVEAHGGEIAMESGVGTGTRVTVTLRTQSRVGVPPSGGTRAERPLRTG